MTQEHATPAPAQERLTASGHASKPVVLVQMQAKGVDVHLELTPEQAEVLSEKLHAFASRARSLDPGRNA